jgi:Ni/Co efflux regulator RcnB
VAKLANSWVNRLSSLLGGDSNDADAGPDMSRRMVLTGAVAAIACGGLLVAGISTPSAAAEVAVDEGEIILADHGRRRSRHGHNNHYDHDDHDDHDRHGRRRSRNQHSRHRSGDHGRRRSRREYNDWNENCFQSPVGWICF